MQQISKCPKCGVGTLKERQGPYGHFLGCSTYPNCKYTLVTSKSSYPEPSPKAQNGPTNDSYNQVGQTTGQTQAQRVEVLINEVKMLIELMKGNMGI